MTDDERAAREELIEVVVDIICINATARRHPYDAAFAILAAINAAGFEVVPKRRPPMSDLADVIALYREEVAYSVEQCDQHTMVDNRHLTAILDAAEAGMEAREEVEALKHDIARHIAAVAAERDAALEEAAAIADKEAALQLDRVKNSRLTFAPDAAEEIAKAIRARTAAALRAKAMEILE